MEYEGFYWVTMWPVTCPDESEIEGTYPKSEWKSEEALQVHLEKKYGPPNYTPDKFEFEIILRF